MNTAYLKSYSYTPRISFDIRLGFPQKGALTKRSVVFIKQVYAKSIVSSFIALWKAPIE